MENVSFTEKNVMDFLANSISYLFSPLAPFLIFFVYLLCDCFQLCFSPF